MAFGVEPPGAKRRLIPAVVSAALATAALFAASAALAAPPKHPSGVEKLWSEYPLSVRSRTRTGSAPAITVARPATKATPQSTRAAQAGHDGSSFPTPILVFLAAAAVLVVAAAGSHALTTEGGTTMPDLFRSRGRRTRDEDRPAAGISLAAPLETSQQPQDATTADAPPHVADDAPAHVEADAPPQVAESAPTAQPAAVDDVGRMAEHVAGIVSAAESAAARIRTEAENDAERVLGEAQRTLEDAQSEVATIKAEAEAYAETRRREADAAAARVVAEAERRALTIADEAMQRDRVLHANIEASEQRLRDLARSLRTVAASLDDVVGDETTDDDRAPARADDELPVTLSTRRSARS